jgi:septum formation protein
VPAEVSVADKSTKLILASGSAIRRQLLENTGITFSVDPADIDEPAAVVELKRHENAVPQLARGLACLKAEAISGRHPDALVIGADQMLELAGEILTKAGTVDIARDVLKQLRGRDHHLHSGVAIAQGGRTLWSFAGSATMSVRQFSDAWLERYVDRLSGLLTTTVGAYQLEGEGIQLFSRIEGDYFTILGLPLLELLAELRRHGVITE